MHVLTQATQFAKSLPKRMMSVVGPDHPLLFSAPDLLVADEGRLAAVFFIRQSEQTSPTAIRVRLASSRLALPEHTRCVLARYADESELAASHSLAKDFDRTIDIDSRRASRELFDQNELSPERRRTLAEQRRRAFSRADSILLAQQLPTRSDARATSRLEIERQLQNRPHAPTSVPGWSEDVRRRQRASYPTGLYTLENRTFIYLKARQSTAARGNAARAVSSYAVRLTQSLDEGVPYVQTFNPVIAPVPEIPRGRRDPGKIARAAAFAGVLFTVCRDVAEMEHLGELVAAHTHKKLEHEFKRGAD